MRVQQLDSLPPSLQYVDDTYSGFKRVRRGKSFAIVDDRGQICKKRKVLARVESMVIPPQWSDVWICEHETGHLQCTGRDQRGRKQYIYHEDYVAYRQRAKFDKLVSFAERLPKLRTHVATLLTGTRWDHDRMLGLVVRLLDRTHLRIGSARYAAENDTYGLTTLRRKHLKDRSAKGLELAFQGKSGKFRRVTIKNRQLRKLVNEVAELPGYELFKYRDDDGSTKRLESSDVNNFLHKVMGDRYSAKDFRTWGGTSLAVKLYHEAVALHEAGGGKGKVETKLVKLVAKELGNTVSVCRQYYIHPTVLEMAAEAALPNHGWKDLPANSTDLAPFEEYTLEIIS